MMMGDSSSLSSGVTQRSTAPTVAAAGGTTMVTPSPPSSSSSRNGGGYTRLDMNDDDDADDRKRRDFPVNNNSSSFSGVGSNANLCCTRRFWCIRDVCGIVCAIFTWLLILYSQFVVFRVILLPHYDSLYSILNGVIFLTLTVLAISSHLRTMLSDPGAVPKGNATKENIERMGFKEGQVIFKCPKCCSIKPERAHHCSVCQRCIRKMDHHCPWVNNCVGEGNQKFFVLFTMYIALMSVHALFMALGHFVHCLGSEWKGCPTYSPPATIIFLLFLIFEALLFSLFTSIMFGTQVSAIWYDETGIESLKKEEARWVKKSRWKSFHAVFGTFSIQWFSPFTKRKPLGKSHGYLFSV